MILNTFLLCFLLNWWHIRYKVCAGSSEEIINYTHLKEVQYEMILSTMNGTVIRRFMWTFLMLTIHAYYAFIVDLLLSFCMVFLFKVTIEHIKDLLRDC